jgi:hypothetical protein
MATFDIAFLRSSGSDSTARRTCSSNVTGRLGRDESRPYVRSAAIPV